MMEEFERREERRDEGGKTICQVSGGSGGNGFSKRCIDVADRYSNRNN